MIMKKVLLFIIVVCMVISVVNCGGKQSETQSQSESISESVEDSESVAESITISTVSAKIAENLQESGSTKLFRPTGRTFIRNGGLACDLSCTGVRFNASCLGEIKVKFSVTSDCYFTVYVNGERQSERIIVRSGDNGTFRKVAEVETYGSYEIEIVKQSQYPMAYAEIVEVQIEGSFEKRPSERKRFIEFYGDSIMNGSNIYKGGTSAATSDATLAFGYATARALNADCNVIGRGGMALYRNGNTDGMLEIWDLCGGKSSPKVETYGFSRTPDCVVVEIGTNDYLATSYTDANFTNGIKEMVFNLRSVYGSDIKIVWCYGYNEYVDSTWEVAKKALDGLNTNGTIYYCPIPYSCLSKAEGGDGIHPDVNIAKDMASALTQFINENIYNG